MYQGEIRNSQIQRLLEKVTNQNYGKYLQRLRLHKVRGFEGQIIKFDFPVTALIGPNGGGKTTILGAAGIIYKNIKPRQYFARSGQLDQNMNQWKIEYEVIDKSLNKSETLRRSATFGSKKWSRDALDRQVATFGVSRTVPALERLELLRIASKSFVFDGAAVQLDENISNAIEKILGKDVSGYNYINVNKDGTLQFLTGLTDFGIKYSEFHFGAGESSIIRMVMKIESLDDNSLILIEEIENGLHPVATRRMVEYLIEVAERKKSQIIFTTHSNDAISPLPSKAIWATFNGKTVQGKLDVHSLRAITGQIQASLVIFTEDSFTTDWLKSILNAYGNIAVDSVEVHPMAGDGTAVSVNRMHNIDPSCKYPSVCFLDGDSRQLENNQDKVFRLPGEQPETYIYDKILDALDNNDIAGILAVALHKKYEDHEKIAFIVREVRRLTRDGHLLYSQVGRRLGLLPENVVRSAFFHIWGLSFPDEVAKIIEPIKGLLPLEQTTIPNKEEQHKEEQLTFF
ncbi:ATP-dependent nuclease [Paenibacillus terrigena]|uniref:ATP-dependent nuclease n=1 Tax=Paenibacillus terrigena TaxID=369333 RepID=UPI000364F460|nr:AAA family ATPase [Paenibacillus terrigena]